MTLQKLKNQTPFQEIVKKLKLEGWKDWHILMATASIAVNYRIKQIGYKNIDEMRDKFIKLMSIKETPESIPVPFDEFGEDELRNHLFMSMPSTLKILGLEYKSSSFAPAAFQEFLEKRCRYFADDIPHEDIFKAKLSQSQ